MSYQIIFTPTAERQFDKFDRTIQNRITSALERITVRPHSFLKRLSGSSYFRLRVGDYRVILDIKNDMLVILVIEVGHR